MTSRIAPLAVIVAFMPYAAVAYVQLSFEVSGLNTIADDFVPGLWFGGYNPFKLDVRLRGDQPLSGITWNWDVSDPGLQYGALPVVHHGIVFHAGDYIGTAQPGGALQSATQEGYDAGPRPPTRPYDEIIASYEIWRSPDDGFYPDLVISADDKAVPLQWWYTPTFPPPIQTQYGVPEVIPFRFVNIGPEPAALLMLLAGAAPTSRSRRAATDARRW